MTRSWVGCWCAGRAGPGIWLPQVTRDTRWTTHASSPPLPPENSGLPLPFALSQELDELSNRGRQLAPAQMHDAPGPQDRKAFDVHHHQTAAFSLQLDRVAGQHRHPQPSLYRMLDRAVAAELHSNLQADAGTAGGHLDSQPRTGARLTHQEALASEVAQRQIASCRER